MDGLEICKKNIYILSAFYFDFTLQFYHLVCTKKGEIINNRCVISYQCNLHRLWTKFSVHMFIALLKAFYNFGFRNQFQFLADKLRARCPTCNPTGRMPYPGSHEGDGEAPGSSTASGPNTTPRPNNRPSSVPLNNSSTAPGKLVMENWSKL